MDQAAGWLFEHAIQVSAAHLKDPDCFLKTETSIGFPYPYPETLCKTLHLRVKVCFGFFSCCELVCTEQRYFASIRKLGLASQSLCRPSGILGDLF